MEVEIDEILMLGRNEDEEKHKRTFRSMLQRCQETNSTLIRDKCAFNHSEIQDIHCRTHDLEKWIET